MTAAASTSKKVKGLTIPTREQYLSKIGEVLTGNYDECCPVREFDKKDIEDCAIEMEYSVFSSTTTITIYRSSLAKMVSWTEISSWPYPYFVVWVAYHGRLISRPSNVKMQLLL